MQVSHLDENMVEQSNTATVGLSIEKDLNHIP